MMFKTHLTFGFLVALFAVSFFHPSNQILFLSLILFSSALPDIDHPNSKIGKYIPFNSLFEHRGFFHSFLFLPIIILLLYYFKFSSIWLPMVIGYSSHLISDSITKEGIMPFHPVTKFRLKGFISTGKSLEYILFGIILVLSIWKIFNI